MRQIHDLSPSDWLVHSATPWVQLAAFGPAGFESYARLRYIPDPAFVGQAEHEVQLPAGHPSDIETARRAILHLTSFTGTPDECYFCVWEGNAWPSIRSGPLVAIPNRRYLLFTGALQEIRQWEQIGLSHSPPAFVWPADRRWLFASDVDPHWAGIGAEHAAVQALLAAPDIDAVHADPEVQPTPYS